MESVQDQICGRNFPLPAVEKQLAPIRVAVTGAAGQIGQFLCTFIAQGRMFGPYQKVILVMIELESVAGPLKGLAMELMDGAYTCLHSIE